jgi:glycosyltransferase involved in cell wall biosynthesis
MKINETKKTSENKEVEILNAKVTNYEKTLREISDEEIEEFRAINNFGYLFDRAKYKRNEQPDVTVIITLRNQAHCIHKAIRSVQNQSLKNIEIIIVNDCSFDNSTSVVEKFMNEDERIKFINHEEYNEGIMISRKEGIRMAKGKYITFLDGDDTLIHKDLLKYSFNVAQMGDIDVVEFHFAPYDKDNKKLPNGHIHEYLPYIMHQPELKYKFFSFNNFNDHARAFLCRTIWGKIIKNEILQKALDNIPSKYLNDYIVNFEDTMIMISLYQVANSYYCLRQLGYYYALGLDRRGNIVKKEGKCKIREGAITKFDHIKYMNFLMDKLDDDQIGDQILFHELIGINTFISSALKDTVTHHFDMAYRVLNKLINSTYLNFWEKYKTIVMKKEVRQNEMNQTNLTKFL